MRTQMGVGFLGLVFANTCFSSFYVGGSVGPEGASFRQFAHVSRPGTFNVIDKNHFSGTGVFGSLFAGYGRNYNQWSLAAEINANLSSVEYKLENNEYIHQTFSKTTFSVKDSEGLSVLPGYFLSPATLVYTRIGYARGKLKITESDPSIQNFNGARNGIRYGLGVKHFLSANWALMMDYSQINYRRVSSHVFEPFGNVTKDTKISPNTAQVGFGVIYSFDTVGRVFIK